MAGAQLRYLLFDGSRLLGGLGFGASGSLRQKRLHFGHSRVIRFTKVVALSIKQDLRAGPRVLPGNSR